jgi:hypothetical protein
VILPSFCAAVIELDVEGRLQAISGRQPQQSKLSTTRIDFVYDKNIVFSMTKGRVSQQYTKIDPLNNTRTGDLIIA